MNLRSSYTKNEPNAFFDNYIMDNGPKINVLNQITMEAMHALLLRMSGRTIKSIQGLIMSKKLQEIVMNLYDHLSKRSVRNLHGDQRLQKFLNSACPLIKTSNNCKVLTGRMKANNVEDFLQVMYIIYCLIFNDKFAEAIDNGEKGYASYFSKPVYTSDRWINHGMEDVFNAIKAYVRNNIQIVHILRNSSVSEDALLVVEDCFMNMEKYGDIIDQVMPFKKKSPFDNVPQELPKDEELYAVDNEEISSGEDETDEEEKRHEQQNEELRRMKINDYPTFRYARDHYAYFVRTFGSPKYSEATMGERGCLVVRQASTLTNHIIMSPQLLDQIITKMTFLTLLYGTPYCMYEGTLLRKLKLDTEMRIKYFTESAKRKQLLLPGMKLQALLTDANVISEDDDPEEGEDSSAQKTISPQKTARMDASNALISALSPKLFETLKDRTPHGASPVRTKGGRLQVLSLNDITYKWFLKDKQAELLGIPMVRANIDSCTDPYVLQTAFLNHFEIDQTRTDLAAIKFIEYRKMITSTGSISIDKPDYAKTVRIQGEEGNEIVHWFGKVLGMYALASKQRDGVYTVEHPDQLAIIVLYYERVNERDKIFDYPVYQLKSIDTVNCKQIISFAHLFRIEDVAIPLMNHSNTSAGNRRRKDYIIPFSSTVVRDNMNSNKFILNEDAKFHVFW